MPQKSFGSPLTAAEFARAAMPEGSRESANTSGFPGAGQEGGEARRELKYEPSLTKIVSVNESQTTFSQVPHSNREHLSKEAGHSSAALLSRVRDEEEEKRPTPGRSAGPGEARAVADEEAVLSESASDASSVIPGKKKVTIYIDDPD